MQRILVVDDDQLVADTIKQIFGLQGFDCLAVYSTNEALDLARVFQPDLLLCDITMPGRDGLELLMEISHQQPDCRILVLTGRTQNVERVFAESRSLARPIHVLTKPCKPALLLREAGAILAQA